MKYARMCDTQKLVVKDGMRDSGTLMDAIEDELVLEWHLEPYLRLAELCNRNESWTTPTIVKTVLQNTIFQKF